MKGLTSFLVLDMLMPSYLYTNIWKTCTALISCNFASNDCFSMSVERREEMMGDGLG